MTENETRSDTNRMDSRLEELAKVLPARGRVLVMPHDYPDPDALASAAGMVLLLSRHYHLRPEIVFTGTVNRAENRSLLQYLGLRWRFVSSLAPPRKKIPTVVVDVAPDSGHVTIPSFAHVVAVVDHHATSGGTRRKKYPVAFQDIRPEMGACATIVLEYLKNAGLTPPRRLCTAMVYAILTETNDLTRGQTKADAIAYFEMLERANLSILGTIRHPQLPRSYFSMLKESLSHAYTYGCVAWTHLGETEDMAFVAETADLILRVERVSWSLCTAFRQDRLVFSIRSSREGAHCGALARRVTRNIGMGGGHHRMAAGYVDLKGMSPNEREQCRQQLIRQVVNHAERRSRAVEGSLEAVARTLVSTELLPPGSSPYTPPLPF